MVSAISVETAQLDERRVVLAFLQARQKLTASRDNMGDLIDEATVAEQHQCRVGKRTAFDAEVDAFEVRQIGDPRRCRRRAEHDSQRREVIGPARHQSSELDRSRAVGGPGTDKIRHSG